jgi:hypothetical protein
MIYMITQGKINKKWEKLIFLINFFTGEKNQEKRWGKWVGGLGCEWVR